MIVVNYTQFRKEMKKYLDMVTDDYETITVTRKGDNDVVVVPADAYNNMVEGNAYASNKELLTIPGASHTDLYDGGENGAIPWDKLESFYRDNLQ